MDTEIILLIDIGNTNTKYGISEKGRILATFALPTDLQATEDSLGLSILQLCTCAGIDPGLVRAWVVSSVVPMLDHPMRKAADRHGRCPVFFVPRDIPLPLENRYARPEEVGSDRLVTAFAARGLVETRSLIVIDFGTATTFDCVQDSAYIGGLICPGVLSSMRSLGTRTAKLPQINLDVSEPLLRIGQSTAESLRQGLLFGFAAMVDGLCIRLKAILPGETTVLATGGLAKTLRPLCSCLDSVHPDLLLSGLVRAYRESSSNQGDLS
jgi:type III pantothenate kinase